MILTDTHTHLYLKQFNTDRTDVIKRSIGSGVSRLFFPNIDPSTIAGMLSITESFPDNCFPMMGLHPGSVDENFEENLNIIEKQLKRPVFCGIGEIGIDLYWDKSFIKQQQQAFITQVEWAKELELPVVIHSRDSFEEIMEILEEINSDSLTGIFHCFTGSITDAERVIDIGLYLGIGGVLTYRNAGLDKVVEQVGLEHIVLETDSPYLTPVPHRGKRNESSYIRLIAEKVAELHHCSLEKVAAITTANSVEIFKR